jgi:Uma2 family endonuclease
MDIQIARPGEALRPLVPDVCYISFQRWPREKFARDEVPHVAPGIVIGILSPDDRPADVDDKCDVYLQAGTALVILADPRRRTVESITGPSLDLARRTTHVEGDVRACVQLPMRASAPTVNATPLLRSASPPLETYCAAKLM